MKNSLIFTVFAALLFLASCETYPYQQGKILYTNFCENCHMADGTGLVGVIPPLAGADFLTKNGEAVPCIIRNGIKGDLDVNGRIYSTEMAGIERLTEFEITNIINYIHTSWGNEIPIVEHLQVREWLKPCEKNTKPF
ncbi:MAG: c-type cytochrome [Bacteroidetes bacterium]|nr:c-type cytochrome [Bacteroidota bacterium]